MTADTLARLIERNDRAWQTGFLGPAGSGYEELMRARPSDPAALAVLCRWHARELRAGVSGHEPEFLEHVAAQLEAMAGRAP
jgi:hypothetical protein